MPTFSERLQHAWNAFNNKDPTPAYPRSDFFYSGSAYNPSKRRSSFGNERSIINTIFNRIAADVAAVDIRNRS